MGEAAWRPLGPLLALMDRLVLPHDGNTFVLEKDLDQFEPAVGWGPSSKDDPWRHIVAIRNLGLDVGPNLSRLPLDVPSDSAFGHSVSIRVLDLRDADEAIGLFNKDIDAPIEPARFRDAPFCTNDALALARQSRCTCSWNSFLLLRRDGSRDRCAIRSTLRNPAALSVRS